VQVDYRIGQYQAGEASYAFRPRIALGNEKVIIAVHGRSPTLTHGVQQFIPIAHFGTTSCFQLVEALVDGMGYSVYAIDAGGSLTWGNDASITAIANAVAWLRGASGFADPAKKVVLWGYSMGGFDTLYYAKQNPGNVAGFIGTAPGTDLDAFHSNATYTAEIDTAYGGAYATALAAGRSPMSFGSTLTLPSRLYQAVDDSQIPIQRTRDFVATLSSTDKALAELPAGDHYDFFQYIDNYALQTWLGNLAW
jgi:alpha-beta hydrolase superfamily lysophospholipase